MALNRVILYGRLTKDVELRRTKSGIAVARFTVACDRPFSNKQTGERECDFIECQAWRRTAEFLERWFSKGLAITVEGSLRNNNYTDNNGVKHYGYVVMADNVGFGGSKSGNQQNGNYQPYGQQTAPTPAAPAQQSVNIGNIGEFEEILSDGEIPF
jgi:single-strand DNA-binding protein